jgi:hypothetical protein
LKQLQKQSLNVYGSAGLDTDVIDWFKKKSGEIDFQSLINAALRDVISRFYLSVRRCFQNWNSPTGASILYKPQRSEYD